MKRKARNTGRKASGSDRYRRGLAKLAEIHGERGKAVLDRLDSVSPDLKRFIIEFAFGDIYARPQVDTKTRQLITIAALTTLNSSDIELKAHIHGALNVGCTREQITETIMQVAVYAGFPAALHGMFVADEAFTESGKFDEMGHLYGIIRHEV